MNKNIRISILGCGWLGFSLAKELVRKGYSMKGSTTSAEKLEVLSQHQIDPFLVQLNPEISGNGVDLFFQSDVLIISIPPKKNPDNYISQIKELIKFIEVTPIKSVLYISSTSVYGNGNKEVNEDTLPTPGTGSGKAIQLVEELLLNNSSFKTTIIRFAGLIGPGRDPAKFLQGKVNVPNGKAQINLIHLDDCVGLITALLERNIFGEIFNACAPSHPSRQDFYTLACKIASLPEPVFIDELVEWKIVESIYTSKLLGYDYKIKSWLDWLIRPV